MKSAPRLVATVLGFACVAAVLPISAAPAKPLNPSFSCWWSEPFDEFEVSPAGATFFGAETLGGSGTSLSDVKIVRAGSTLTISGTSEAYGISVKITKEPGSDGMSDASTPYAGLLNGVFNGACIRLGSGTIPKTVTGVADGDKLNVRALPSASSKIVATIPPRGSVWIYPQKAKNGWLKVSAIRYPPKESGFVTVVDGWVNSSFVSK
jgi:hypothetical protein